VWTEEIQAANNVLKLHGCCGYADLRSTTVFKSTISGKYMRVIGSTTVVQGLGADHSRSHAALTHYSRTQNPMLWAMHMLDPYFGFSSLQPYPGISHRLDYLIRLNVTHCVTSAAYLPRLGRAFEVVSDLLRFPAVCKGTTRYRE
jgi:hypothetical protein